MYQFKEECHETQFFWWDKKLIENKNWALLPKSAKAIYPVIACHCNKKGEAFPGEQTIAILSGRTEKKVREGIRDLEGFSGFEWHNYLTKRGRRSKKFHVTFPPIEKGRSFPFFKFILESGFWRELKPSAQALYPVMRHFAYFDYEMYVDKECLDYDPELFDEIFKERDYDFCEAEKSIMAEYAGIARRSLPVALKNLEENFLIESTNEPLGWKVFLRSRGNRIFLREYLNTKIGKTYRHAIHAR